MNKPRLDLPFINMPDYFSFLLTSNIQNNSSTNTNLEIYFSNQPHLAILIKKLFRDIDQEGFLGKILSISGFLGVRNRLTSAFLEKKITGHYSDFANQKLISDILQFEHQWRHFSPLGYSRIFLLGFYLKLISLEKKIGLNIFQERHIDYMQYSKGKSIRIDWLMLTIVHFDLFLGADRYLQCLKSKMTFEEIFSLLSSEHKELLLKNYLNYASSIGDKEFFTNLVDH